MSAPVDMAREGERGRGKERERERERERSSRDDIKPSAAAGRPTEREPQATRACARRLLSHSVQCRSASAEPDRSVAHLTLAQLGLATVLSRHAAQRGHGPLEALSLSLSLSLFLASAPRSLDISAHSVRNLHCGLQISQLLSRMAAILLLFPSSSSSYTRFDPQCSSLPAHPSFDITLEHNLPICRLRDLAAVNASRKKSLMHVPGLHRTLI